jgi:hypothetical protein
MRGVQQAAARLAVDRQKIERRADRGCGKRVRQLAHRATSGARRNKQQSP